jgi:Fe2+ transport system protein FeoA
MHPMTLTDLAVGQSAVIEDIAGERVQRMKLLDVGLVPQTVVTVRKIAPMGDPIEVGVRSYVLTLRKAEAALIKVKQETVG